MPAMGKLATTMGMIGVESRGSGSAVPIVFLHGVGSDKSVWRPQLEHLSAGRPAIAFDYPGYGESDPSPASTRDDFAAAMLAAMDSMAIPRAHICGLSLGGVIAIGMHAAAPDRCASLVLADTFAVHPDGQAIYDRSISASRDIGMRALAEARAGALLGSAATDAMTSEVIATMSRIDPVAYACGAQAVWLADQRERVAAIAAPTLVICGDEDAITPPQLSRDLATAIAGSSLAIIPRSGHLANMEQPGEFNRLLDQFLSE